jgi:stage V sporulation protein AF
MEISMSEFFYPDDFHKTVKAMNAYFRVDYNFDLVHRVIRVGPKQGVIYCIDGFVKEEVLEKLQEYFYKITPEEMPKDAHEMSKTAIPYVEVDLSDEEGYIKKMILSGVVCLIVEGFERAVLIDCRTYPARSVEEPQKYKVLRGSRDGFVETLVSNAALIRRRIRSTSLSFEVFTVGKTSLTDVCVCYMEGRVNSKMLSDLIRRIQEIQVDALTMNQESLAECLYKQSWWNPFPKFKYSERPDATAASILEGHIIILVDNSPAAMILPTTLFDVIEEADDYYFPPVTGTYLRFARTLLTLTAMFLTPTFLLLTMNPQWIPGWLSFVSLKEAVHIPIVWQLLILEVAIDGLKLAAINTPTMLNTPLSLIAAIVVGETAAQSGWFNTEVMLYMAVVAIANFTHESYELGYALKFMRMITIILTAIFNLWGYIAGILFTVFSIASNHTITGTSYLEPLIPFRGNQLFRRLFRVSLRKIKH